MFRILMLIIGFIWSCDCRNRRGIAQESPLITVEALAGSQVLLPCNITPPEPTDRPILLLFYQGTILTPVFSLDARGNSLSSGTPWSEASILGNRASVDLTSGVTGLVLQPLYPKDEALYRCRVDFASSPTRNSRIQLQVIVPPKQISISTSEGSINKDVVGPFLEGQDLELHCIVDGGDPRPSVAWWLQDQLIDDELDKEEEDFTVNTLQLLNLKRSNLHNIFTCKTVNSNLTKAMKSSVKVDMKFPPLDVNLETNKEPVVEGSSREITCTAHGSRPPAEITWWKNGKKMSKITKKIFTRGNITKSTISITPTSKDDGAQIVCRAVNPVIPQGVMEASTRLQVHYQPQVELTPGTALKLGDATEGLDFYFECKTHSNPQVKTIKWFYNNEILHQNIDKGIIQSNQSLVLQKIKKHLSGTYQCEASNALGTATSESLFLKVKYRPICSTEGTAIYGIETGEEAMIACHVTAFPKALRYKWSFNSSSEVIDINEISAAEDKEVIYKPKKDADFGTLLCWAENDVGWQLVPCVIHITHSSIPDPVKKCVFNLTSKSAIINCEGGWNGGLEQTFTLELIPENRTLTRVGTNPRAMASRSTSIRPFFVLTDLEPNSKYTAVISAVNNRGLSRARKFLFETPMDKAEKHTSQEAPLPVKSSWPWLVISLVVTICSTIVVIVIIFVWRFRSNRTTEGESASTSQSSALLKISPKNPVQEQSV